MIFVLEGREQSLIAEERKNILKKYLDDDYNYQEFSDHIDMADFNTALHQVPMMADWYVVYAKMNKKQYNRLKEFFTVTPYTCFIIECTDFIFNDSMRDDLNKIGENKVINCSMPKGKDLLKYISNCTEEFGFKLDLDDRKYITQVVPSLKEIKDLCYQMSFLSDFDRQVFLKDYFSNKQKFVWDMFIALIQGNKRAFFTKYVEQVHQNLGSSVNQSNMKIVGGLLYCLSNYDNAPGWYDGKIKPVRGEMYEIVPWLYCELLKILTLAKKERDSVLVIYSFVNILSYLQKIKN